MAIQEILPYRCNGCGICIETCISDVLRMKKGKAAIVYPEDCMSCFMCQFECPRYAIKVEPQGPAVRRFPNPPARGESEFISGRRRRDGKEEK